MGQAIHIFKKDVRHLRFEIAIAITVAALFAFIETKHALWPVDLVNSRTLTSYLALLLLPVAWWMLIGRVVHDEALPGDRQFWLTRPYSWRSLLGAKLLFILAFVNLPMLIAQMVIVHAYGFSLGAELVGLVWSQVLLTIVFVLPILAISALTDGFVQLIAGSLTPCVIALAVFGLSVNFKPQFMLFGIAGGFANGHDWVRTYLIYLIITVAASAILFWQYSRRRTAIGRSFAAAAWILVGMVVYFISWNAASKIDYALSRTQIDISSVRLVSDLGAERRPAGFRQGGDYVGVHVPLQFAGLPSGTRTRIENLSMTFQVPDGTTWIADGFSWENPDPPDKQIFVQSGFFGAAYLTHNDVPVKIHGTIDLTVYGNPHTTQIPFGERSVPVAHVGLCSANENPNRQNDYFLVCNSAFRAPTALVSYRFVQPDEKSNDTNSLPMRNVSVPVRGELGVSALMNPQSMSFSPFPANLRISPVSQDFRHSWSPTPWDHAVVETLEPVGHVRFDFDIDLGKVPMYRSNNNEKIRP
jgi:hypothetical protein|nr:ABC transporter permease [Candidatus Acidoferrales bacterium]